MGTYVEVSALDYTGLGATELTTKTYHGLEILVNGIAVGRISEYTPPARTKKVSYVRELSTKTFGRPIETVPAGNDDGDYKISCKRTEVWGQELEIAFGFAAQFIDLMDQTRPFILEEKLLKGAKLYRAWDYHGCWFTSITDDAFAADGEAKVIASAELAFTSRQKTT